MLENNTVRIAIVIVLVILLFYLVITLARGVAQDDAAQLPFAEPERLLYASLRR